MAPPKPAGKKAPGLMSFVVWRQFFMVLAAPGIATAALSQLPRDTNFIVVLVVAALPSLLHGQLWKWTYDWSASGDPTLRNLRIGQVAAGVVHSALAGWALFLVFTDVVPWEGAGFYFGLTIAGLLGGVWETIRPALELRAPEEPPPPKTVVPRPERSEAPSSTRIGAAAPSAESAGDPVTPPTEEPPAT